MENWESEMEGELFQETCLIIHSPGFFLLGYFMASRSDFTQPEAVQ
jgi:hypothetical protein